QALNLKTPAIYDTIHGAHGDERVFNPEETQAAREKQRLIKERFKAWVFSDPDRTERLVRIYNDTYNNLRPRMFDGSHLDFPGMSQAVSLKRHQADAVWRCMTSGNTLLAHCVGAGKTYEMAASGMKMKQAGLIKKPMFVVPNHMLEQFGREFMHLYPNAKLLIASKEDFTRERRKYLTAKIATGDWDGIIVTHSSFERIGMSKEYQERFLREQIAEYEALLRESKADSAKASRNIIKTIEKQKVAREEKLKSLAAEDKKDDGLVFDELGVDQVFIDELQFFKNLETPTKMERVAGIQTGGSERAFDLYMKARYLDEKHPGHGLVGATGTPISNSMVEMYTMQRFLEPKGLTSRGIEHFDAWAATFGEVVDAMEISPDGKTLKPRVRFARFNNLPELQQMFRAFADVQTAEMLNLPRPKLQTGKPITVACPMSEEQCAIQQHLVERYERLRSQKVDPREDNALAITTDGRKLALDARMLSAAAPDFPGSKVNALVENVEAIWRRTEATRGTQMVFCDMGVNPTPWGYSAYDDVIGKLVDRGIPRSQIAAIGDADSDAKKRALFDQVRSGQVRILLGSTHKMGT
ncbi:MAG: DEAD/DEAH box helicase family protein, partial [Planctomycetota bacterium]|nr:DEAD/DEAH box helicase family protein [Planctomycetota bacterium]